MRVIVVGAGAWGLPAAAELATRGHQVQLIDTYGPANRWASSGGASRLWRLSHPDEVRVRLAQRAGLAWRRLEQRTSRTLLLTRGLLWRDPGSGPAVAAALAAQSVPFVPVTAADVGRFLPGLQPNGVDAVWQADAGPVFAHDALMAQLGLFVDAGGQLRTGGRVVAVDPGVARPVRLADGGSAAADVVVLAPGPGAPALLTGLGIEVRLRPVLEQVTYLRGGPGWPDLPCWYEGEHDGQPALYAMPTPGLGYKVGLDRTLRELVPGDLDRTPDPQIQQAVADRVGAELHSVRPEPIQSQVCSWTDSPDGRFVIDRLCDGKVVLACGDSGEGFKFSALFGDVLADLVEGRDPDPDIATFTVSRFGAGPTRPRPALGR